MVRKAEQKQGSLFRIVDTVNLKERVYKGRSSPIRQTDTYMAFRQWIEKLPGRNEAVVTDDNNPELKDFTNDIKLPLLAFKRRVKKAIAADYKDYLVDYYQGELAVYRKDSQLPRKRKPKQ